MGRVGLFAGSDISAESEVRGIRLLADVAAPRGKKRWRHLASVLRNGRDCLRSGQNEPRLKSVRELAKASTELGKKRRKKRLRKTAKNECKRRRAQKRVDRAALLRGFGEFG